MLDAFVERQTRTLRGNTVLIFVRLLLATVALSVLIIQQIQASKASSDLEVASPLYSSPAGLVAIIVCALTVLYVWVVRQSAQSPPQAFKLAFLQIFVDIFLISALIWNTGGVDSQFVVLYLISICSAAFVLKWNVALLAATASTVLFCVVFLLYSLDIIPSSFRLQALPAQVEKLRNLGILDFLRLVMLPICAFFLAALLSGTLSRRVAMARLLHDEILEGIGEGILVVDGSLRTQYHNREFQRLLRLNGALAEANVEALLGKDVASQAREVSQDGVARRIEINHRRTDKTVIPLSIRIAPVMELDGPAVRGLILALDDITAERKIEEFDKHKQRIETMGHISATIAHEIRNPLASIRGAVQEIGRSLKVPADKKILIDIAMSETDRLDQIITDYLRFARMRLPKFIPTDLGRVLSDTKLNLSMRPDAKGTTISLSGDEGDPFAADPEQLRQLFLNLGINALQAMNGGPRKELSIRLSVVSLHLAPGIAQERLANRVDRQGVLVEFEDSGMGMPESVSRQAFEPFFTTKSTGTGLGLAIVERIVQAHEGLIAVDSQQGRGTIFRIWLPTDLKAGALHSGLLPAIVLS